MSHLKKLFLAVLMAGFVLGPAIPSHAETSTASMQALIATLQAQIADLQSKLVALKQAQNVASTASGQVAETAKLLRGLREGMSGDDVKTIQAILAKYPDIYPEGLITGFYGKATARAVKKFQEREGVEGVGYIGPKTLAKLHKELEKDPIGHEDDDNKKDKGNRIIKRPCAIVPPGHLIAPGWLRKHDGVRPIVPPCQKLPPGIESILKDGKGTTTPDTMAPVISGLTAGSITTTSAHIKWMTNEKTDSKVIFATSMIGSTTATSVVSSADLTMDHDMTLTGLSSNTTYYYYVQSADKAGNLAKSSQMSFQTSSVADVTPPVISSITATVIATTSAHITWATNESATGKVWYSATSPVTAASGTPSVSDGALLTSHDMALTGLAASTTYYYIVESSDASGNKTLSGQQSFTTLSAADVTAPVISAVTSASVTGSSAHVTWTTDELSDSTVWYSTSTPIVNTSSASVVSSANMVLSHDLALSGLATSTQYYYITGSKDAAGNSATSAQYSFTTTP